MFDKKVMKLKNGIIVLHEKSNSKVSQFEIHVRIGSYLEKPKQLGISHLAEHLMFKGTTTRTCTQINKELELYGAEINAFTDYNQTCYHGTALTKYIDKVIDIYSDTFSNLSIDEEEFKREKNVVLQEIKMYEDNPFDCNINQVMKKCFKVEPIAGYYDVVSKITLDDVYKFRNEYYCPENIIISAVTGYSHRKFLKILNEKFGNIKSTYGSFSNNGTKTEYLPLSFKPISKVLKTEMEREHLYITNCYNISYSEYNAKQRAISSIFVMMMSDGLSSILFREIREKYGIVYGISLGRLSDPVAKYKNFVVSSQTQSENYKIYQKALKELFANLKDMIAEDDLEKVKNKLIMGDELSNNNLRNASMNYNYYLIHGKFPISNKASLKIIESVTLKDMLDYIDEIDLANKKPVIAVAGPCKNI